MKKKPTEPSSLPPRHKTWLHLSTFGVLVLTVVATFGFQVAFAGKVAPNTFALNVDISFEEAEKAQEEYSEALDRFETVPVSITFKDQTHAFTLSELGVTVNKTASVEAIPVITSASSPWSVEGGLMGEKQVKAVFTLDQATMEQALTAAFITIHLPAQEPQVVWNSATADFTILPEQAGWKADLDAFEHALIAQVETLSETPIEIAVSDLYPVAHADQLEPQKESLNAKLAQPMTVFTTTSSWSIDWREHTDWLTFTTALEGTVGTETVELEASGERLTDETSPLITPTLKVRVNPEPFAAYVNETIAPEVEVQPQDVTILMDDAGVITFEGTAVDGVVIADEPLPALIDRAFEQGLTSVELPLTFTKGKVNAPEALREKGITELIGTGYSSYTSSPANRQHNIATGIARFNGAWVEPGAEFSFGEQLGPVDASTGYKQELVIKEEGTIPEYGGGICQVSSTMYRAILFTGLPVVERHPHSYAVTYYAYPLGYGLDSTVYPPQVDLVFKNDMITPILMQSYVEGNEAYFKFYGTKDGRAVQMDGPYISNRIGAPAAIYTVTPDLAAGVIIKKDTAHNGFTAVWNRTVTYADGTQLTETIVSAYRAWAAKYAVGEGTEGYGDTATPTP